MLMFRRGRRLFSIASVLMILTSIAHTLGHFQPEPQMAEFANLKSAMQAYQIDLMGMKPSAYRMLESLSLTLTIMLLMLGLQNLLVAAGVPSRMTLPRFAL